MPLPCTRVKNRIKCAEEALAEVVAQRHLLRLTVYYTQLLQKFVEVSEPYQEHLRELFCNKCVDTCCRNTNYLHMSDVLRAGLLDRDYILPAFEEAAEPGTPESRQYCAYRGDEGCILQRADRPLICIQYMCGKWERFVSKEFAQLSKAVRTAMEDIPTLFKIEAGLANSNLLRDMLKRLDFFEDTLDLFMEV